MTKGSKMTKKQKEKMSKSKIAFFARGGIHPLLGKKHSQKTIEQMKESHKGFKHTNKSKKKISKGLMGREYSIETIEKLSISKLGNKNPMFGKHPTKETRVKIGIHSRGEKNYFWKGGVTPINTLIRNSLEYKLWRESVFKRDNYTCIWCGIIGGKIHADHIKQFAYYPELRFDINNGRTLCIDCHKKTDSYLSNKKHE